MVKPLPKCAVLPSFVLTETCDATDPLARKRVISSGPSREETIYYVRDVAQGVDSNHNLSRWAKFNYNLFPVVIDRHGVPWAEATIYILSRCQAQPLPDMTTFHGIAEDLSIFRRFLDEFEIDYLRFPRFQLQRPTYRFKGYLRGQILQRQMAPATARRAMGSVTGFYRFLAKKQLLTPEYPMWQSRDRILSFRSGHGTTISKVVTVTDITIPVPKQDDPYDGCINDGERLRPLPQNEQKWLIEALAALQNPEMLLLHLVMLSTGARLQTACTLRLGTFINEFRGSVQEIRLKVGAGTGVDTKSNKQMTLHFPHWLYEMIRAYAHSDRASTRREKQKSKQFKTDYLFLTQNGTPYYQQKAESLVFDPNFNQRYRGRGQTIRMFIRDRILPWIRERYERDFHYKPHDLRATYGMNLTDVQLAAVEQKKKTLSQARDYVRVRMGHDSAANTDLYLNYRQNQEIVYAAVDGHEIYFRDLIEKAWQGTLDAKE